MAEGYIQSDLFLGFLNVDDVAPELLVWELHRRALHVLASLALALPELMHVEIALATEPNSFTRLLVAARSRLLILVVLMALATLVLAPGRTGAMTIRMLRRLL